MKNIFWIGLFSFIFFVPSSFAAQPVAAKHVMVTSEQHLASKVGVDILRAGGNAIDAAVAIGYALAVVDPCCGNIGGGGFMTLHLANGSNVFLNFRERAPLAAKKDMFLDSAGNVIPNKSLVGYAAVATPGTVMGFEVALKKYGTMTRQQVIAPAIQLAEKGFILTKGDVKVLSSKVSAFKKSPNVAAIFLKNNQPYQIGDRLVQLDLAKTLKQISKDGPDVFYKGKIAAAVVKASQENGGLLTLKDFSDYKTEMLKPIYCTYRGYTIVSAPPPSSGGITLCEMLNILEGYPLAQLGYHSAESIHYIVEAMRYAYADRNMNLGDPDFVINPEEKLLSKKYASEIRQHIEASKATPSVKVKGFSQEGVHTTHYSVIDQMGNAASVTYTLNSFFGAKVIAGNTGFFLNNIMDDFTIKLGEKNKFNLIQGFPNIIQPGKRPLSSMTPTIILKDNKIVMVVGSPGGPRIITAILQTLLNVVDYRMNIQDAVAAPRFHHQWLPDIIESEPFLFSHLTKMRLAKMGYKWKSEDPWGAVEAIYIDPQTQILYGANDVRRPAGKALGY